MVRFEKKFNKKSAGILKYFEDFLLNFFSKMAVLCAASDRKTFAEVLIVLLKKNTVFIQLAKHYSNRPMNVTTTT